MTLFTLAEAGVGGALAGLFVLFVLFAIAAGIYDACKPKKYRVHTRGQVTTTVTPEK